MELLHLGRWRDGRPTALRLGIARPLRRANHLDVPRREQFEDALIETKVADRILNLPVLDEPHTVARKPGEQRSARIDTADVPEAADEQSTFGGLNHLFYTRRRPRNFDDLIYR